MNKTLIAAVMVVLAPVGASAQERVGDAALGAASGLILGPVGVVAGAVVGYTVGPNIASAWGMRRSQRVHRTTHYARRAPRSSTASPGPNQQLASAPEQAPVAAPEPAAPAAAPGPAPVPAQGFE